FVLQAESLKGKGSVDFGGQTYTFDFDLKRGGEAASGGAGRPAGGQQPPRREVPQPQQKQSASYFVGEWTFNWIGRESALGRLPERARQPLRSGLTVRRSMRRPLERQMERLTPRAQ